MDVEWERVALEGKLVYWRKQLPDGSYFAVSREGDRYRWARRGPDKLTSREGGGFRMREHGTAGTTAAAKRAADAWLATANA